MKIIFFGNYCSLRSQSCFKHSTKWVNEVEWVSNVKVILWPWSKVTQISKLKLGFLQKQLGDLEPKLMWKLKGEWEWKFVQMSWVAWPTWLPCPYMVKTLENLLLQNQYTNYPWNLVWNILYASSTKIVQIMTLGIPCPFYAKVKFGHIGFCMGKSENYLLFGNYCSIGSQSCLKHSAK